MTSNKTMLIRFATAFMFLCLVGVHSSPAQRVYKLQASDAMELVNFGVSIDISDEQIIAGAPGLLDEHQGQAYIFERQADGTWLETTILRASDGKAQDRFGQQVAISGKNAFVRGISVDDAGNSISVIYVFERKANGDWVEQYATPDLAGWPLIVDRDKLFTLIDGVIHIFGQQQRWNVGRNLYPRTRSRHGVRSIHGLEKSIAGCLFR